MQLSRIKRRIIGFIAALLLPWLAGCNTLRLAYSNGPQLAWWWVDAYADFNAAQTPPVKQALERLFDWHRRTQLDSTAALLASVQPQLLDATTPAQACKLEDRIRTHFEPTLQHAVALAAEQVSTLTPANFKQMEGKYVKLIEEARRDYLQPDAEDRIDGGFKRTLERAERFYGKLDAGQKHVIRDGVAASPFNTDAWLAERLRRQRDTLQTLKKLVADRAGQDQRVAALQGLVQRSEHSPDPAYRAQQLKMADYNCAFAAQIHNATTPAQRRKARNNVQGWEADLRAVLAAPASP